MISLPIWELILLVSILLFIEGLFSGSEIAILSLEHAWIENQKRLKKHNAKTVLFLSTHPEFLLSTTLLLTAICVISITSLITLYFHGAYYSAIISSLCVIFLGELIPKSIFRKHAKKISFHIAPILFFSFYIFYPLTKLIQIYTSKISKLTYPLKKALSSKYTIRNYLKSLLRDLSQTNPFVSSQKHMIKKILSFQESETKTALIPMTVVKSIKKNTSLKEALEAFQKFQHSILPIYEHTTENIIGLLYLHDIFTQPISDHPIFPFIRTPLYIADLQTLKDALFQMALHNTEMSIVVNEHGHAIGILTAEDIMEEILGSKTSSQTKWIQTLAPYAWCIEANIQISQLNEILKTKFPEGDYETLAGYLIDQFKRIPQTGDSLLIETPSGKYQCVVQKSRPYKIKTILLRKI